jgi:hypothetical protein
MIRLLILWVAIGCSLIQADSHLLGPDKDKNLIRDDVAQWIETHYKHPVERGLLRQAATLYQRQLKRASGMRQDIKGTIAFKRKYLDSYIACELYWTYEAKGAGEAFVLPEGDSYFTKALEEKQFDTPARKKAAAILDSILEGRTCPLVEPDKNKCDFKISKKHTKEKGTK